MFANILLITLGLAFGSFGSVLISRIPENLSLVSPSSRCDFCGSRIAKFQLIPIFSFLFLKGKTKCCENRIPRITLLTEFTTAILFVAGYHQATNNSEVLLFTLLAAITVPLFIIDIKVHRLPNKIIYPSIVIALTSVFLQSLIKSEYREIQSILVRATTLTIVFFVFFIISRGGMGLGDYKFGLLLVVILIYRPWQNLLSIFIISFITAGIYASIILLAKKGSRKSKIPFGPFLIIGAWLIIIAGTPFSIQLINIWKIQ